MTIVITVCVFLAVFTLVYSFLDYILLGRRER